MNQQIRSIIFGVAGLLVLAGAVLFLTHWAVAPYLFADMIQIYFTRN